MDAPNPSSLTVLFERDSGPSIEFVVVHGLPKLSDDAINASKPDPGRWSWVTDDIPGICPDARVSAFMYGETDSYGRIFSNQGIKEESQRFLDALVQLTEKRKNTKWVLIGHDIGGIIVMEALVLATWSRERYWSVLRGIGSIVFLGCPQRSPSQYMLRRDLTKLLGADSRTPKSEEQIWALTESLSACIQQTQSRFSATRVRVFVRILSVYSSHEDDLQRVFDRDTATTGAAFEIIKSMALSHEEMIRGSASRWIDEDFVAELSNLGEDPERRSMSVANKGSGQDPLRLEKDRQLAMHASPICPRSLNKGTRAPQDEEFSYLSIQQTLERRSLDRIRILCPTRKDASAVAEAVFTRQKSEEEEEAAFTRNQSGGESRDRQSLFFFDFVPTDDRFNSVDTMLYTFFSQAICQICHYNRTKLTECGRDAFQGIDLTQTEFGAWNVDDLFSLFSDILLSLQYLRLTTIWVLGNFDATVQSSDWLVTKLNQLAEECEFDFKIIITCSEDATPLEGLKDWLQIAREIPQKPRNTPISSIGEPVGPSQGDDTPLTENRAADQLNTDLELLTVIQRRPELRLIAGQLSGILLQCGSDEELRSVILSWHLARNPLPTTDQLAAEISQIESYTPENLLQPILDSVLQSGSKLILKTFLFLLSGFRPLSPLELWDFFHSYNAEVAIGEMKAEDTIHETVGGDQIASSIFQMFGGLLDIRRNQVVFAHPQIREVLSSHAAFLHNQSANNQEIATLCLEYMISSTGVTRLDGNGATHYTASYPSKLSKGAFFAYAAKYWPSHAEKSNVDSWSNSSQVQRFLEDRILVELWVPRYRSLANPYLSGSTTALSAQEIFARHGLDSILKMAMHMWRDDNKPESSNLAPLLASAARENRSDLVQFLSGQPIAEGEWLDGPILAALSSGNQNNALSLIRLGLARGLIRKPQIVLFRAVSRNQKDVVEALVPAVTRDGIWNVQGDDKLTFRYACARANPETFALVMKHTRLDLIDEDTEGFLCRCCQYSQHETVSLVAKAAIQAGWPEKEEEYYHVIMSMVETGRFRALQAVLEALHAADLKAEQWYSWISSALDRRYDKCFQAVLEHVRPLIDTNSELFRKVAGTAIGMELRPPYKELLQCPGAFLNENLSRFLFGAAARRCKPEVFETLLKWSAAECSQEEVTLALESSAREVIGFSSEKVMSLFLKNGLGIEHKIYGTRTLLSQAAYLGEPSIVRVLIAQGADLKAVDVNGWLPIHASYDNAEVTRMLLEAGADVNARTSDGISPLVHAAQWNYKETLQVLLEFKPDADAKQTALAAAVSADNMETVQLLLDAGTNPRLLTSRGSDALRQALSSQSAEIVRMLLEYGADLESPDEYRGDTTLHLAAEQTSTGSDWLMVKLLVNRCADIDAKDSLGDTPLSIVAARGNTEAARYLLARGASLNTDYGVFGGPLIQACYTSMLEMVKLLCEHDADVNLSHHSIYSSPLHAALYASPTEEKDETLTYLVCDAPHKADIHLRSPWWGVPLNLACISASADHIQLLLDNGALSDINAVDEKGRRPIHFALYHSKKRVELLTKNGAELFVIDNIGRGPLHVAVLSGRLDLVQHVLESGEGRDLVNEKDNDGWTPLLWALRWCPRWQTDEFQRLEIVRELLGRRADLTVVGSAFGGTWDAMKLARYYDLPDDIISELESGGASYSSDAENPRPVWDPESQNMRRGKKGPEDSFCDACLTGLIGIYRLCTQCDGFCLCFKCFRSKDVLHPDHIFNATEEEWESSGEQSEPSDAGDALSADDDQTSEVAQVAQENAEDVDVQME